MPGLLPPPKPARLLDRVHEWELLSDVLVDPAPELRLDGDGPLRGLS